MAKRKGITKPEVVPCPNSCGRDVEMVYEGRGYVGRCPCSPGRAVLFRRDSPPTPITEEDKGPPQDESPLRVEEESDTDETG